MDEKMLTDDVFVADPVEERLMLGNEAVAACFLCGKL